MSCYIQLHPAHSGRYSLGTLVGRIPASMRVTLVLEGRNGMGNAPYTERTLHAAHNNNNNHNNTYCAHHVNGEVDRVEVAG